MRRPLLYLLACLLAAGTATATTTPVVAVGREAAAPSGASGADGVSRHPLGVGRWTNTGMMAHPRTWHTATLLASGKVLVAGGFTNEFPNDDATGTAELYDPAVGTWQPTGHLVTARLQHTATLLPNGKVLVTGGVQNANGLSPALASAELYDPATRRWTATGAMHEGRIDHRATLLTNGKVLVEGGLSGRTAELYDPATGHWTVTGSMTTNRFSHTATALPGGKVLVTGGGDFFLDSEYSSWQSSAEVYDPVTGRWTATQSMSDARIKAQASTLPDGRVLVSGGYNGTSGELASTEVYDAATRSWATTGALHTGRSAQTTSLLANGTVLTAGGYGELGNPLSSAEVYDPTTGQWKVTGSMSAARENHTATVLATGKVLVTGGFIPTTSVASTLATRPVSNAELYKPAP